MYEKIIEELEKAENKPQVGFIGQRQHISVTAILAKINIDLVMEIGGLRQTVVELDQQNAKLTKAMMLLSVMAIILAIIQVLPILLRGL